MAAPEVEDHARAEAPASCPACGGALTRWGQDLERCVVCATAVTSTPAPGDPRGYGTDRPRLSAFAAPVLARFDRRRLALLAHVAAPPGRLLEVGAGRGRFVAAAARAGYEARGIEPSAGAVEAARQLHGVTLERVVIGDAAVAPGSLGAVVLWHVLEHLDDPAGAVAAAARWLRPGGAVLVGVPNLASLQARIGGRRWFHLDLPRHRTHFTPAGLDALLTGAGLEPVSEHHVLAEHNPFGMWQTIVSRLTSTSSWLFRALEREVPLRSTDALITLALLPLAPLAALLELVAGLARRGGTIAVVARRPPA